MKSGIYIIRHRASGRVYVGSAVDIADRWGGHKRDLTRGTHRNPKLQNAWNKYGAGAFVFEVVERVDDAADLIAREQHWLDLTGAALDDRAGYNIAPRAGSQFGVRFAPEVRARMGAPRGRKLTPEHRAKVAAALRGRKMSPESIAKTWATRRANGTANVTMEQRSARSKAMTGRVLGAAQRERIGLSQLGQKRPSVGVKRRAWWKSLSTERRAEIVAKISASQRGREVPQWKKDRIAQTLKGRTLTAAHREAIGASLRGIKRPEWSARMRSGSWKTRRGMGSKQTTQ
jgi:group I intron endonuclease